MRESNRLNLFGIALAAAAGLVLLYGCVPEPMASPEPPPPVVPPLPDTRVYVYPAAGQSEAQLDRDKYECHVWAVHETGFDPSAPQVAPHARVEVVPVPAPGANTLAGAATGAIIGSAVSRPRDAGAGALLGALAGAIIGNSADQARMQQAANMQSQIDARDDRWNYGIERRSNDYRRALSACLQGRSYTIK